MDPALDAGVVSLLPKYPSPIPNSISSSHASVSYLSVAVSHRASSNHKKSSKAEAEASWVRNYNLRSAAESGQEDVVKMLLVQDGIDVNMKDFEGQTPLLLAAKHGHDAVIKLLLARDGIDVNAKNWQGWTALTFAAENGYELVVKLLLAREEVDVYSKSNSGATPLSCAASRGHEAIVQLLLKRKAPRKKGRVSDVLWGFTF